MLGAFRRLSVLARRRIGSVAVGACRGHTTASTSSLTKLVPSFATASAVAIAFSCLTTSTVTLGIAGDSTTETTTGTFPFRGKPNALFLQEATLDATREEYGMLHEKTLKELQLLAQLCADAKEYDRALDLFREVLGGRTELLGPNHVDSLETAHELAGVENILGNKAKAAMLYHHAMKGRLHKLGLKDRRTQATIMNYADLLWTASKHDRRSEIVFRYAVRCCELNFDE